LYFIGQPHIMKELSYTLPYLHSTREGMNILIRGPSGWGKTRMSFMISNYLTGGQFSYQLADKFSFDDRYWVHFIDEVHLLLTPEVLYPLMDSGKYVILLATNDAALLTEALVNRCTQFNFEPYSMEELREITKSCLTSKVQNDILDYIIESGGNNPRVIKNIVSRINIMMHTVPNLLSQVNINEFRVLMEASFGIRDGLDTMCYRYMEALTSLGGAASLQTLGTYLHTDSNTLRFYVEPVLLYKNLIRISSKGRSLVCPQ
jgi:Holliday junction resolvasome RuvABC ATP-dependent DNA helicase subunit